MVNLGLSSLFDARDYLGPGVEAWQEQFAAVHKFRIVLPPTVISISDLRISLDGPQGMIKTVVDHFRAEIEAIVVKQFKEQMDEFRVKSATADWERLVDADRD